MRCKLCHKRPTTTGECELGCGWNGSSRLAHNLQTDQNFFQCKWDVLVTPYVVIVCMRYFQPPTPSIFLDGNFGICFIIFRAKDFFAFMVYYDCLYYLTVKSNTFRLKMCEKMNCCLFQFSIPQRRWMGGGDVSWCFTKWTVGDLPCKCM